MLRPVLLLFSILTIVPGVQVKLDPRMRARKRRFDARRRVKQLFDRDRRSRRGLFLDGVLLLFGWAADGVRR